MKSFAVVLVCYNRIAGIKRLLKSLEKVDFDGRKDIHLIFSIDHSGSETVLNFANAYQWPYGEKHVRYFSSRQGLKKHILQCGDFTQQFDIVAILEDDLYLSDSFYHYSYQASEFYWDDDNIAGISLYSFQKNWLDWFIRFEPQQSSYDTYFLKIAMSWGQIWLPHKWKLFMEWYKCNELFEKGDNIPQYLNTWPESSWLKYHDRYCIETNRYFVYPYVSISTNFSDAGEHAKIGVTDHQVELMYGKHQYLFPLFSPDAVIYDEYMEREGLEKYVGLNKGELTVDYYGTKKENFWKRYLISTNSYNYKIIKSYALSLRPIELSIINDIDGEGIYLYDTQQSVHNRKFDGDYNRKLFSIRSHSSREILRFSIKLYVRDQSARIKAYLNKMFKARH